MAAIVIFIICPRSSVVYVSINIIRDEFVDSCFFCPFIVNDPIRYFYITLRIILNYKFDSVGLKKTFFFIEDNKNKKSYFVN
ncbi:MAG: hypothetical protein HWN79_02385 [Candidatus Lokiarchaeota archaeon]|nr:hypothetical protein [Candidatus Lokiarchaeota archaeon]